jgi:hypothetical protein
MTIPTLMALCALAIRGVAPVAAIPSKTTLLVNMVDLHCMDETGR